MFQAFIGSEAVANGVSWGELQRGSARIYRDVYVPVGTEVTAVIRAQAAWLWSRRRAVVAGLAAAAVHGSKWVDATVSVDLYHDNRHRLPGLTPRSDRLSQNDVCVSAGLPVTTPARTALDLACWHPLVKAVAAIDALARATDLTIADAELLAERQGGRRGIIQARRVLGIADAGAQSPKESWLRTLLVEAGLPRPETQIPIRDEFGKAIAYLDMGWEDLKVAVEYDGDHHRTRRSQYSYDIRRLEMLQRRGWIVIRVTAEDSAADVLRRVSDALARRR
ncbi:MAG: endonuclease domain-containing protein [Mycobacterium sp.]